MSRGYRELGMLQVDGESLIAKASPMRKMLAFDECNKLFPTGLDGP